jgi:P-type Ca2+ transporter type 2C
MNWWHKNIQTIEQELNTSASMGLNQKEIPDRLKKYGLNQLKQEKGKSPITFFLDQFKDFIIWVLIGASLVSGFLGEWVDAIAIIAIVFLNAVLGFIQEFKAEKSLSLLKKLSSPNSKVIRNGKHELIPSNQILPGDLIELEAGDNIPADSRVVWLSTNFSVKEASLTGESTPVFKTHLTLQEGKSVPLAERANMIYLGTSVSSGKARAFVVETGMNTELGAIASMIQTIETDSTPLQKKLEEFGKWIVYLCFFLVAIIFIIEELRGGKLLDVFLTAVSLAVASIPEGLPAVVTVALALGVERMVKQNALIRKLPSVETLGCATVICSDKTGTLTKNEMTARFVFSNNNIYKITGTGYDPKGEILLNDKLIDEKNNKTFLNTLNAGVLCNGAELKNDSGIYSIVGDPTEGALLTLSAKQKIYKEDLMKQFEFIEEIPFDSDRKKMTIIRKHGDKFIAYVKGAPDVMITDCNFIEYDGIVKSINSSDKNNIMSANDKFSGEALRVLAIGYRIFDKFPEDLNADYIEKDLVFLGLVAMIDPPREEVKEAIRICRAAYIKTVMITGDHKNTAIAIAKELGFFEKDSLALSGEELDKINDDDLIKNIDKIRVYARVSPEHKLRIVRMLKKLGYVTAMTGDGVNDAPSIKEANIGIAMGITGTDVTKEVSDMVITDDNFASIVSAIFEGRGIYDNIKKFVQYLLSCNTGEILVMFTASVIGFPVPLLPIQILWINLVTDGFPALALGMDPVDKDIMKRPPRNSNEPIITKQNIFDIFIQGSIIALCSLSAFIIFQYKGIEFARTSAFIVLSCSQLFHAFNCRNTTKSLFSIGIFTNKKLILAVLISLFLQISVVYFPFMQNIFKTESMSIGYWLILIAISSIPLWSVEIIKKIKILSTKS